MTAILSLLLVACTDDGGGSPAAGSAPPAVSSPPAVSAAMDATPTDCGYLYEWLSSFRFPLQPDPHAAYSYVVPKITAEPVALEITGQFPHAVWTSWTIYTDAQAGVQPFSVVQDAAITPDAGSVNPFVPGTPVLAAQRSYRLLVLPAGVTTTSVAESLQDVPGTNILSSPTTGSWYVLANRVYHAFPGYNQGGAGGPTAIAFPTVRAVNYQTGAEVDCADVNELPSPRSPDDMPTERLPSSGPITLRNGDQFAPSPQADADHEGSEYAPAYDPDLIEFTRPPILPGADVPSVPPPDHCAGYLGAATSTTEIGLIRIPHVATWFDTGHLTPETLFEQDEVTFISLTQYGSADGSYAPGEPTTASLGDDELLVDASGGATIVVWPRSLTTADQQAVFAHAAEQRWAILRGDEQGPASTSNLFVREKGTSPSYQGGYTPTAERSGVPCYFDDNPTATEWNQVSGAQYVAGPQNIGSSAPQGINCSVAELLDDSCLQELQAYMASTGASYEAS